MPRALAEDPSDSDGPGAVDEMESEASCPESDQDEPDDDFEQTKPKKKKALGALKSAPPAKARNPGKENADASQKTPKPKKATTPRAKKSPAASPASAGTAPPTPVAEPASAVSSPAPPPAPTSTPAAPPAAPPSAAMAPLPSAVAPRTNNTPKGQLLAYMKSTNRPYSVNNIFDNMHKKIPKATAQKICDELVEEGQLCAQEWGKNKVYYMNQDRLAAEMGEVSQEKLQLLEAEHKQLSDEWLRVSGELRKAQSEVQALQLQPTDTELDQKLEDITSQNDALDQRLAAIRGNTVALDPKAMLKAKAEFNKHRQMWVERKRKAMEMLDRIGEGQNKKRKQLVEDMGIEEDPGAIPDKLK